MSRRTDNERREFSFNPVGDPEHLGVLSLITLDEKRLSDPGWVAYVQYHANIGDQSVYTQTATPSKLRRRDESRACFEHEIGIHNPDHPLHYAYVHRRSNAQPLPPNSLIRTILTLQEITGDSISAIHGARDLIGKEARSISRNFHFIERASTVLGWQGDARELVRENPRLLLKGMATLALMARLFEQHGSTDLRSAGAQQVAKLTKRRPLWCVFTTINGGYCFGSVQKHHYDMESMDTETISRYICEELVDDEVVSVLGASVTSAYFRCYPAPRDVVKAHPHLYKYIPASEVSSLVPNVVLGTEAWLTGAAVPKAAIEREAWLAKLNTRIHLGSKDHVASDKDSEIVLQARSLVFEMFGWANAKNPAYTRYRKYFESRFILDKPIRIVDVCNTLEKYGVTNGLEIISGYFKLLTLDLERIGFAVEQLREVGLDPQEELGQRPTILGQSRTKLKSTIQNLQIRRDREARAAAFQPYKYGMST